MKLFVRVARFVFILLILATSMESCAKDKYKDSDLYVVKVHTSQGDMYIALYNETPLHRDNFLELVREKFYDGLAFHRVINGFMIQAGDPDTRDTYDQSKVYGGNSQGKNIPAEFNPALLHRKGALAAARMGDQVNPEKMSSGSQFYIVQGKPLTEEQLQSTEAVLSRKVRNARAYEIAKKYYLEHFHGKAGLDRQQVQTTMDSVMQSEFEKQPAYAYPAEVKKAYLEQGGTPHLDMDYTVYGQVVDGLDVVDKIAAVEVGNADLPKEKVEIISMEIVHTPKGASDLKKK